MKTLVEYLNCLIKGIEIFPTSSKQGILPFVKILNSSFTSYSQFGQDLIAEYYIGKTKGDKVKIVDIGSNHPIEINNTYYFEKNYQNAQIVSIDANPIFPEVYKNLRKSSFKNFGVAQDSSTLPFYIPTGIRDLNNHVYASFDAREVSNENIEIIEVQTRTLGSIIEPSNYDLLFIDVEGFEMSVLKGIEWNKFSFEVVIIENNSRFRSPREIRGFMSDKGYKFKARLLGVDDIFICQKR